MSEQYDDLTRFAQTIVHGTPPASQIDTHYANYTLASAVEVYRNNYRGNLHDALAGAYPVTKQLVGDGFFRMMALRFIEGQPSHSANLHHYGAELADFVASFEPARELVYLPDVATLEWACHTAYFAADETAFDLARLAQFPPEQHPFLILRVHPAVHIFRSRYPVNAIWQAHQPGADSDFHIDLGSGNCSMMVFRKDGAVQVAELPEAETDWLQRIQAGVALGNATEATLEQHPDFDLGSTMIKLVTQNVLIDVR